MLKIFAALPREEPLNINENDAETMRYVLEHSCLPGKSEPAPVVIAGYLQKWWTQPSWRWKTWEFRKRR